MKSIRLLGIVAAIVFADLARAVDVTNYDSVVSLATSVTKNYTFTDPVSSESVTIAVTMTPYSSSNANPVFAFLDNFGNGPLHIGIDSGLGAGDANWMDSFEGVNFSASLVSSSAGVKTNSIQFGITSLAIRPGGGILTWTSSACTNSFTPQDEGLFALDTNTTALAGIIYSGQLRFTGSGQELCQLSDNLSPAGQSVVLDATFSTDTPSFSSLSFTNGQFQFTVNGTASTNYIVQATTNLAAPDWISVATNTAPFQFTDTNANAFSQRFYRAKIWP